MENEPKYGYVPNDRIDKQNPPGHKSKEKYRYFDMDLNDPEEDEMINEVNVCKMKLIGDEGWEIIKITDAIKIGKQHFIRIFVKKCE